MPEQEEHQGNSLPPIGRTRIIGYDLSEDKRSARIKIRVVSGPRAEATGARQAQVIMEVAQWAAQHRRRQQH